MFFKITRGFGPILVHETPKFFDGVRHLSDLMCHTWYLSGLKVPPHPTPDFQTW